MHIQPKPMMEHKADHDRLFGGGLISGWSLFESFVKLLSSAKSL